VGVVVGLPALRVKGIYLAIATLSFGFIVEEVLARWESVTKGNAGIAVGSPEFFGAELGSSEAFYYIALGTCAIVTVAVLNLSDGTTTYLPLPESFGRDVYQARIAFYQPDALARVTKMAKDAILELQ